MRDVSLMKKQIRHLRMIKLLLKKILSRNRVNLRQNWREEGLVFSFENLTGH